MLITRVSDAKHGGVCGGFPILNLSEKTRKTGKETE